MLPWPIAGFFFYLEIALYYNVLYIHLACHTTCTSVIPFILDAFQRFDHCFVRLTVNCMCDEDRLFLVSAKQSDCF